MNSKIRWEPRGRLVTWHFYKNRAIAHAQLAVRSVSWGRAGTQSLVFSIKEPFNDRPCICNVKYIVYIYVRYISTWRPGCDSVNYYPHNAVCRPRLLPCCEVTSSLSSSPLRLEKTRRGLSRFGSRFQQLRLRLKQRRLGSILNMFSQCFNALRQVKLDLRD